MTRTVLPLSVVVAALVGSTACSSEPHWPDVPPPNRCAAGALGAERLVVDVDAGGRHRQAIVYVPPTAGPHDVAVVLHEFRSNPERQVAYSGWKPFAAKAGVILVAPDGRAATWNAGDCCGKAVQEKVDDVAYLDAIVAKIEAAGCATGRVLATGIGNGAMMAEQWACVSDAVDAVVSVGGSLQVRTCEQTRPIPWLHYHGDADHFVPADGSDGILDGTDPKHHWSVAHAAKAWRTRNQATGEPSTTTDGALTCTSWPGGAPTTSCVVHGGADAWPGAADDKVATSSALADATSGAWAWVSAAWGPPG